MVTSPHDNCISREHPHVQGRLAFRDTVSGSQNAGRAQLPASVAVGDPREVGSGLLCFPGSQITDSQGNRVIRESFSTSLRVPRPAEHRVCPHIVPVVSRQPGLSPRGHCRYQPAASKHGELGGVVLSSAGGSKRVCRAILFSWKSSRTDVPLPSSCPWLERSSSKL